MRTALIWSSWTLWTRCVRSATRRGRGVGFTSANMRVVRRASRTAAFEGVGADVSLILGDNNTSGGGDNDDGGGDTEASW